ADCSLDENCLLAFVRAYQDVRALTIGEVWAVPIMLRVVLLENLARLARQMRRTRADRARAHEGMRPAAAGAPWRPPEAPSDASIVGARPALRDLSEVKAERDEQVRSWLSRLGAEPTEVLRREHQRQAANQVSIGNAVTALRLLAALDWARFFERVS